MLAYRDQPLNPRIRNVDMKPLMNTIQTLISSKKSTYLQEIFEDVKVVLGYRQSPSMPVGKILTRAKFQDPTSSSKHRRDLEPGIFVECQDSRRKLCQMYIQECSSFKCANGEIWKIECHINCNSKNVEYYLVCNMCNVVTYTDITETKLRIRTNNHISCCKNVYIYIYIVAFPTTGLVNTHVIFVFRHGEHVMC